MSLLLFLRVDDVFFRASNGWWWRIHVEVFVVFLDRSDVEFFVVVVDD